MSFITPQSSVSAEQAPIPGTSTASLAPLSAITCTSTSTSSSSSSSSTTQTQPQKKKLPWGPILNLFLVLVVIILLIVSIVQTWFHIHSLFSVQDSSSCSTTTSPTTATNGSSSSTSSKTIAAAPQFGGDVDLGLTSSNDNVDSVGEARDSHAVITSRPLVVRAVDIPPPPPHTAPVHDPSTVTQHKTGPSPPPSQPQPHIRPGPHPEQQQQHTPSPEGTGPKRVSKNKLDGIDAHTASTHDHPNRHPHDETSDPDSEQNNEASPAASRNTVILTICAALGGLAGCFCCILGSSRLAICCYYRRRGIVASSNAGVVCVDGKRIGPPQRPISGSSFGSSFSSSASLVSPTSPSFGQQPQQQQVQMTEFWNVDDPKDSKKSPTSSTSSFPSPKGFFKTLRRPSYANTTSTSIPDKKNKDALSRLPLAVTAPTAHVISSPVDFIPPQHSLDSTSTSSTTSPRGGGGLDSYYPPYTGGSNNLDFDPLHSPNPSSTMGSGSGPGTKSRRMPLHSPLPLPLSMPVSLKRNSCQHASSPLSSGLISPCTTMTPSTAGSSTYSSSSDISPFPWSKAAPYLQNTDDNSHSSSITGRTMVMSKAQKPQHIDTDTASTLTTPATTAMMHTSPRSTRSPFLSPTAHSLSTTPTVPKPPSTIPFPRHDELGANANAGTGSGSNFRGPRPHDHPHHNHHRHIQHQPQQQQQQQQHSYQHSQYISQNSHSSHNSPMLHYHQQPYLYYDNNTVYQ